MDNTSPTELKLEQRVSMRLARELSKTQLKSKASLPVASPQISTDDSLVNVLILEEINFTPDSGSKNESPSAEGCDGCSKTTTEGP